MSHATNDSETMIGSLGYVYAPVQHELAQVEQILRDELRSPWPFVDQLVRYGAGLGGKRLRPALLLLAGKACGQLTHQHLVLAAVIEMIHTATLVHDDVLDEAEVRRHLATVNSRWDNETSVLLGDYLFTHAFYLASTLDTTYACRAIGRATNVVCEGELRQVNSKGNYELTESQYLSIIQAKTAELCACACHLGAYYAGADEHTVKSMAQYGLCLGIAFQITDDLLDIYGDETATGKSLGTDLIKQKPTLPLIHVFQQCTDAERDESGAILDADSTQRRSELICWLDRFEAAEYTATRAHEFADQARDCLSPLPPSPTRQILLDLTEFVTARTR